MVDTRPLVQSTSLAAAIAAQGVGRPNPALGIFGQSNEASQADPFSSDYTNFPLAFRSGRNPYVGSPMAPRLSRRGGWWSRVYDDMYDWGYDLQIVNGAIGGTSFILHAAGQLQVRGDSIKYYQRRPQQLSVIGDRGDAGDYCIVGTRVFNCTTGNIRSALGAGPFLSVGNAGSQDSIVTTGTLATGTGTPAAMNTANVGDTVTDGGIVWTCVATTTTGVYAGLSNRNILSETHKGYGFDPLGLLARLEEEMGRVRGVKRKIIYIQNGQGDLGYSTNTYADALQSIANYFLNRFYDVMIGYTIYYPVSSAGIAGHDALSAGVAQAITNLQAQTNGSRVFAGPNLYQLMGTTGPMASGGAFLQSDNLHLNGLGYVGAGAVGSDYVATGGVFPASYHVRNALRGIMPKTAWASV